MCQWGTNTIVNVKVSARCSHAGVAYCRDFAIDSCIASIVKALTDAEVYTTQSCCGHGKGLGRIDLEDGRVLLVCADAAEAERVSMTVGKAVP